ncbi:MAG: hypothetical protein KDD59_11755, partial [Bdellovibrionales bacterium]|nr:hypothetical protein [Bdellovibrionales bacterium]
SGRMSSSDCVTFVPQPGYAMHIVMLSRALSFRLALPDAAWPELGPGVQTMDIALQIEYFDPSARPQISGFCR